MKTDQLPAPSSHHCKPDTAFIPTRWSLIRQAGNEDRAKSVQAMEELCHIYRPAVLDYIRRRGYQEADAEDLTQGFFVKLLKGFPFDDLSPTRGRFRAYLFQCVNNFLSSEYRNANRLKRGGGATHVSMDLPEGEGINPVHIDENQSPEKTYDRAIARCFLKQVLKQLMAEYSTTREVKVFHALRPFLTPEDGSESYKKIADELGMTTGAVRTEVCRLRERYRELMASELKRICDPEFFEDEWRSLKNALSS